MTFAEGTPGLALSLMSRMTTAAPTTKRRAQRMIMMYALSDMLVGVAVGVAAGACTDGLFSSSVTLALSWFIVFCNCAICADWSAGCCAVGCAGGFGVGVVVRVTFGVVVVGGVTYVVVLCEVWLVSCVLVVVVVLVFVVVTLASGLGGAGGGGGGSAKMDVARTATINRTRTACAPLFMRDILPHRVYKHFLVLLAWMALWL